MVGLSSETAKGICYYCTTAATANEAAKTRHLRYTYYIINLNANNFHLRFFPQDDMVGAMRQNANPSITKPSTARDNAHNLLAKPGNMRENLHRNDNDSHFDQTGNCQFDHFQKGFRMIVCVCNNISDREIRQAVELGITSMDELRRDLGVATCCGQCASYAEQVLQARLSQTVDGATAAAVTVTELSFRTRQAA
jgi:bacterioferritin-associated ferredoxin